MVEVLLRQGFNLSTKIWAKDNRDMMVEVLLRQGFNLSTLGEDDSLRCSKPRP
jgi:hypothetical protein